jgi:hypothetical protein
MLMAGITFWGRWRQSVERVPSAEKSGLFCHDEI